MLYVLPPFLILLLSFFLSPNPNSVFFLHLLLTALRQAASPGHAFPPCYIPSPQAPKQWSQLTAQTSEILISNNSFLRSNIHLGIL